MDVIGITFDRCMKGYITVRSMKISKWVDPKDLSLDIIFRLTIEHKPRENEFKKLRGLHIYFRKKDLNNIIIEDEIIKFQKRKLKKSLSPKSKEHKLEERISPLGGYVYPIFVKKVEIEEKKYKKRIKVNLEDYDIAERNKRRNIIFSLRFNKSIATFNNIRQSTEKPPWFYNFLIEPFLAQTLKWDKGEFMPVIEYLGVWLQIPKELYGSLSAVDIQPMGTFEQMFLLGKDVAKEFRKAGQPLAQEETLCINWRFSDISISSPPQEIEVTCGLRQFEMEPGFVKRFEDNPQDSVLILREILYMYKIWKIDFTYIISHVSNKKLKKILDIFSTMVFRRNLRPVEENLNILLPLLEDLRCLSHGEEFYIRYELFYILICCRKREEFFSEEISLRLRQIQEYEDMLDPDYAKLAQDLSNLIELMKKSRYKEHILSKINNSYYKWTKSLMQQDSYILTQILSNWESVIESEYEVYVPLPRIDAEIKTKSLVFADKTGFVLSIRNTGAGEAKEIYARLIQAGDYDIITERSEIKAYLKGGEIPFEPELAIKPRNERKAVISYEIRYKDALGREAKNQFRETIDFIKEKISFQRIENPYIIGEVVRESSMFYGREELIEDIIGNFRGKYQVNPIFLYGQKRTGKTSMLFHLKRKLRDEFAPVFFNILEIFGKKSFYEDLMKKIIEELEFTDIEIPHVDENPFGGFKNEFYAKFKQRLKGKKILLMIDEYQRIDQLITEGYYDDSVVDFLNALVQDGEIKIILAGFLQPDELRNDKWMSLMKFFTTKNISFLRREDVVKLICEPVKGLMEYGEGGIEKIISLSKCHPYFVQLICHTMVEHHNRDMISLIGYNDVDSHLFNYFEKGYNVFVDIILNQTQETERKILFYISKSMEKMREISVHRSEIEHNLLKYEKDISRIEAEKALSHLERKEIIKKSDDHPDYYEFAIGLYRHWVKWNMSER